MNPYLQTTLLGLVISLIFTALPVNAGTSKATWMSLYEWDGNTYVLNNEKYYTENDEFLIDLLNLYNHVLIQYGRFEEYSFCIGLVFYYRGNSAMARKYLQWVANHAEKQHYVHTAEAILKKL